MQNQLAAIVTDMDAATARLQALAASTPAEKWSVRADPARWSVGECIAHLNLTSNAFLPHFRGALEDPVLRHAPAPSSYRIDLLGRLLLLFVGPVKRFMGFRLTIPVKTSAAFVPSGDLPREQTVEEFERLQGELLEVVRASDGKAIDRVRVPSPFDKRASYSLYSALAIVPRHQHRHLQQAEEIWGGPSL